MSNRESKALNAAEAALLAHAWATAASLFQKLLAATPGHPAATHGYGVALLNMDQPLIGIAMLERSVKAAPDDSRFHHTLAQAVARTDPARALGLAARACTLAPAQAEFALLHAFLLESRGRPLEAITELERVGTGASPHQIACKRLVELCFARDQLERAEQVQQALLQHWPELAADYRLGHATPAGDASATPGLPDDMPGAGAFADAANLRVIDGFLPDPDGYRANALSLDYQAVLYAEQNFPGRQTAGQPCAEIMARIATLLGKTIKWISPDNGAFRLSTADSSARADIHIDQPESDSVRHHAGVLYLNPPEQCRGGTTFWRHRPTGWDRRPSAERLREQGYASALAFQRRWLKITKKAPFADLKAGRLDWEPLLEVPMRWNRLVVYRSDFFHSISDVFGSTPEDGRLVQLFFFETVG